MKLNELKQKKIWLRAAGNTGKAPAKVYSSGFGGQDTPSEMGTFEEAQKALKTYNGSGVGICLGNGVAGIDFDHVRNPENGLVVPEVRRIIEKLNTYTEISKSGTGLHCYLLVDPKIGYVFRADAPVLGWENPAKDGEKAELAYHHPVLDENTGMYVGSKFYVLTGNIFEGKDEIRELTEDFKALAARFPSAAKEGEPQQTTISTQHSEEKYQFIERVELTQEDWKKVQRDTMLSHYFKGNLSNSDNSENHWTFVQRALEVFKNDGSKVYSVWMDETCGLRTEKRDAQKYEGGLIDYYEWTIYNALYGNNAEKARKQAASIKRGEALKEKAAKPKTCSIIYHKEGSPDNALEYLTGDWYKLAVDGMRKYAGRLTGFENLDKIQPLYPGLYVFGAGSSMGKTTFMHQMADQLAARGEHVIFFSMEQTRVQMVSKSLSRTMYKEQQDNKVANVAFPAIDLYSGKTSPSESSIEAYKKYAARVNIVECTFETRAADIMKYVEDFMQQNPGIKPVVFVDYLQIIPPEEDNSKATPFDTASKNVKALKNFQKNHDLVMFVISSLNRANYYIPLDFESFKNSGDIEYSADCVWGLELAVIQAKIFEEESSQKGRKRKIAAKEKAKEFRRLRLVCLKNRFGLSNYSVEFQYVPKFDTFECHSWEDVNWDAEYPQEEKPKKGQTEQERKTIDEAIKEAEAMADDGDYIA